MVNTDILVQATRMGFKIKEVPVTHFARTKGRPTGANLRVIAKAFKELVRLSAKLRSVQPVVSYYERRRGPSPDGASFSPKRGPDRRQRNLPINFRDRRRRDVARRAEVATVESRTPISGTTAVDEA
jgi:hypothetical protein